MGQVYRVYDVCLESSRALPFIKEIKGAPTLSLRDELSPHAELGPAYASGWTLCHQAADFEGGPVLKIYEHDVLGIWIDYAGWSASWPWGQDRGVADGEAKLWCWAHGEVEVAFEHVAERVLLPLWRLTCDEQVLALHGSAVSLKGRAYVFLGGSGAGKSTTAHALGVRGLRLVSDDMVLVDVARGLVLPGAPTVRLWRAELEEALSREPVSAGMREKHWFKLPESWAAREPLPLGAIIELERAADADVGGVSSLREGLVARLALLAQCFDLDEPWAQWSRTRMSLSGRLLARAPLRVWRYAPHPRGEPAHVSGLLGWMEGLS